MTTIAEHTLVITHKQTHKNQMSNATHQHPLNVEARLVYEKACETWQHWVQQSETVENKRAIVQPWFFVGAHIA
jgi:hypothetical protein